MDAKEISTFETENEDTQKGKFLTFKIGKEGYGFEIQYVNEIIGIQKITTLPDYPSYIKGVINLRGKVIPVYDVRLRFGIEEIEYNERTCIIVVNLNDAFFGLIVDEVSEVIDIPETDIKQNTELEHTSSQFITSFGKLNDVIIILLDINKLIEEETECVS